MSSFLASYGRLGPGAFAVRIITVIAIWAGLVFVMLHYVGKVWPHEYQIREAEEAQADENARKAAEKPADLLSGNATAVAAGKGNIIAGATGTAAASTSPASSPATSPASASSTAAPASSAPPGAAPATADASAPATSPSPAPRPAAIAKPAIGPSSPPTAASASAAPATSAAPAATSSATPGKPEVKEPPRDPRLDGYNRHAFFNVAIFYSIVISVLSSGAALSQIIKRLRDLGWNGMLSVLFLVPGVNVLFILALMFTPGKPVPQPAH